MTWLVWVLGAVVIAAAGVGVAAWPWWRDRDLCKEAVLYAISKEQVDKMNGFAEELLDRNLPAE
ncbi:hypothetical protein AB0M71_46575, partial [Amycolatopsis sp. NPDC051114]